MYLKDSIMCEWSHLLKLYYINRVKCIGHQNKLCKLPDVMAHYKADSTKQCTNEIFEIFEIKKIKKFREL